MRSSMFPRNRFFEDLHWMLCGLLFLVASLCPKTVLPAEAGSKPRVALERRRWSSGELIKAAVVSALRVQLDHPDLQADNNFLDHLHDTMHLILLFGPLNSPHSLETLASLSSYALPEADSNIYSCVLLNKGKAIEPFLKRILLSRHPNECIARFGARNATGISPGVSLKHAVICLDNAGQRQVVRSVLHAIAAGETCNVNEIRW